MIVERYLFVFTVQIIPLSTNFKMDEKDCKKPKNRNSSQKNLTFHDVLDFKRRRKKFKKIFSLVIRWA
jgi:hypothetical protein